jgi:hypothetical protein
MNGKESFRRTLADEWTPPAFTTATGNAAKHGRPKPSPLPSGQDKRQFKFGD